jgi:DNA invertase Pin-like site-specific DNA recombinase
VGYSEGKSANIIKILSQDRMAPYLMAANGGLEKAIHLYERNNKLAEAFFRSIGLSAKVGATDIARQMGIGRSTVYKVLNEAK